MAAKASAAIHAGSQASQLAVNCHPKPDASNDAGQIIAACRIQRAGYVGVIWNIGTI
ncbi:hypothetical protein ABD440_22580 [Chromobacterium piscinae]|uniref:hypothetical protein n=1 Tax=Chromobacterium piscinae TaxID=686831 RepID=UPI0031FD076E